MRTFRLILYVVVLVCFTGASVWIYTTPNTHEAGDTFTMPWYVPVTVSEQGTMEFFSYGDFIVYVDTTPVYAQYVGKDWLDADVYKASAPVNAGSIVLLNYHEKETVRAIIDTGFATYEYPQEKAFWFILLATIALGALILLSIELYKPHLDMTAQGFKAFAFFATIGFGITLGAYNLLSGDNPSYDYPIENFQHEVIWLNPGQSLMVSNPVNATMWEYTDFSLFIPGSDAPLDAKADDNIPNQYVINTTIPKGTIHNNTDNVLYVAVEDYPPDTYIRLFHQLTGFRDGIGLIAVFFLYAFGLCLGISFSSEVIFK
jgi:hypothetical protein